jgi:hypothetical protein
MMEIITGPESISTINMRVRISQSSPPLYKVLSAIGPYYRVKRLVQLAALGLAVEEGKLSLTTSIGTNSVESKPVATLSTTSSTNSINETEKLPSVENETKRYTIPPDAAEAMGNMFDD